MLESGRLAEEVTDCGPVIDLKATAGCQIVKDKADPKAAFPDCCPVYDCEEGTEVVYVNPPKSKVQKDSNILQVRGSVSRDFLPLTFS